MRTRFRESNQRTEGTEGQALFCLQISSIFELSFSYLNLAIDMLKRQISSLVGV